MKNTFFKKGTFFKAVGMVLAGIISYSSVATEVLAAESETQKEVINGYTVTVVEENDDTGVYKISDKGVDYILTVDKETEDKTVRIVEHKYHIGDYGFFVENDITYDVDIEEGNEDAVKATLVSQNDNEDCIVVDTDGVKAQASIAAAGYGTALLAVGVVVGAILLYYLLRSATRYFANMLCYAASDVMDKIKKYKPEWCYFYAFRSSGKIWVGKKISYSQAVAVAKANLYNEYAGIFTIGSSKAQSVAAAASPIGIAKYNAPHGMGVDFFKHYHPMLDARTQAHLHVWYI